MKTTIHYASQRGFNDYGWLKSWHSFNFSDYFNPLREKFGVIRVLNDEVLMPGASFEMHQFKNLEIIVIPTSGSLIFQNIAGEKSILNVNNVLMVSSGKGYSYLLKNNSDTEPASLIQIWIFPKSKDELPIANSLEFKSVDRRSNLQRMVSPEAEDNVLIINQTAYINRINLESGEKLNYQASDVSNNVLVFILSGKIMTHSKEELSEKDSIEVEEINQPVSLTALSPTDLIIIEASNDKG